MRQRVLWLGGGVVALLLAVGVSLQAQPVIAEMKLKFYDTFLRLVYDANPNTVGDTTLMEFDGDDAQVNITGKLTASGGFNKTYTIDFTPGEIANTTTPAALPVFHTIAGLVHSAAAQQLDIGYFANGNALVFMQSTAQTLPPVMDSVGLDISGDKVDGEQWEVVGGILGASGKPFVVGVDPAFGFCATLTVPDGSAIEDLTVGFRTANVTNQATLGTYTDYYVIGIEGSSGTTNPVPIYITTGNDGSDTATDTTMTWADAATKTLCTLVSAAGAVTYTINGAAPTVTAAISADDGDMLIPTIRSEQAADTSVASVVQLTKWRVFWQTAGQNP